MDLFIVRHAWAGHSGDPEWPDDTQRPLTAKGQRRFARMVKKLAERGLGAAVIATSPMVRCVQTAQVLSEHLPGKPAVVVREELLPGGNLDALLAWKVGQSDDRAQIIWVGHAPDVSLHAAAMLAQADGWLRFTKGAICAIRFPGPPQVGAGQLRWLVTAKVLGID